MGLFIGIDSGTQGVKAVVLDEASGRIVARATAPHALISGLPARHMEQHPRDWVAALDRVLLEVTQKVARARVRAIGVSGQQHGLVPLDGRGEVIRPAKLWCDTSTVAECDWLNAHFGGRSGAIRRIGLPFLPGYTAPKILWLRRHEPRNYRRLRHVLLPHDYLNWHLTGCYTMEAGDASGSALLDVRRRRWSSAAIDAIDPNLADWLPPLQDPSAPAGTLRPELARRYRLPAATIVSAGGGDNMMAAIGTGNVRPGVVTLSLGTSGTLFAWNARPVIDARGEVAAFCDSTGGWLPLVCTMNVTLVTEQFRRLFGWTHAAFDAAVGQAPPGAGGLTLTPYLVGERTPDLPLATGTLSGITLETLNPPCLARAALEGVTAGLGYGLERLATLGIRPREVRLTGGGARSAAWRQVIADAFGVGVVKIREDEAAALGAALQAAWCVAGGGRAPLQRLVDRAVAVDERTRSAPPPARARRRALRPARRSTSPAR